jgi:hypothetical protein
MRIKICSVCCRVVVVLTLLVAPLFSLQQCNVYGQGETPLDMGLVRLKHKIVPLSNPVYRFLDYCEALDYVSFLPQARPYSKLVILNFLQELSLNDQLQGSDREMLKSYIKDLCRESNGFQIYKQEVKDGFAVVGFGAETSARAGVGKDGTYTTSLIAEPYLSGDLGEHLSFHALIGPAIERLAPDLFYESYTKDGKVNFPHQSIGNAYLPYQFNYETLYTHTLISSKSDGNPNVTEEMSVGFIYFTELNANWLDGKIQMSLNNQRRAWGLDDHNLMLSSTARRSSGVEFKIEPTKWIRYSYLTSSLFSYANQSSEYKQGIYGYDIGDSQNLFNLQLLEFTPANWIQVSASVANIWSKRVEISYLMPFVFSHFSQLEVGDNDNQIISIDATFKIPGVGKVWGSFMNDEFSFHQSGDLLRMPGNRYAWQVGMKTGLLSSLLHGTLSTLKYTRVTPFAYTHYPETEFNTFTDRPLDQTYTNDGFNLGFYLPPNSGEFNWSIVNVAIPDLILTLDNKLIIHGTNDLASSNIYQIYGDIYRYQIGDRNMYPLLDFTKDGIYDWTVLSDLKVDWKVRGGKGLSYFRVIGSLGFARTWWESNNSGVVAPDARTLVSGSLGVVVDI